MELAGYITGFMELLADDPRFGPQHISLVLSLLHFWQQQNGSNPIAVFSGELRKQAKIRSTRSYYSCMKDLKEWGFIRVAPSYNPSVRSRIFLAKMG